MQLSKYLQPIYDLIIASGNKVERIDEPAGTKCPLAIIFKNKINKEVIEQKLKLLPNVQYWENKDSHYPLEAGYSCKVTGHVIAGPLL